MEERRDTLGEFPMFIYYNTVYGFGEKSWDNVTKKPTKIGALIREIQLKRERKSEFMYTLMRKWSRVCVKKDIPSLDYSISSGGGS